MVLRRVCCREGLSRSLLVRTARRFPSRARSACGGSSLTRAAASSMASGNPSRWAQISATTRAFALVTLKSGLTACAREMKRATASYCDNATRSGKCLGSGTANGGTTNSCSPRTCKMNRLVASTLSLQQVLQRLLSGLFEVKRLSDGRHDQRGITERGQVHEKDAIGKAITQFSC